MSLCLFTEIVLPPFLCIILDGASLVFDVSLLAIISALILRSRKVAFLLVNILPF